MGSLISKESSSCCGKKRKINYNYYKQKSNLYLNNKKNEFNCNNNSNLFSIILYGGIMITCIVIVSTGGIGTAYIFSTFTSFFLIIYYTYDLIENLSKIDNINTILNKRNHAEVYYFDKSFVST